MICLICFLTMNLDIELICPAPGPIHTRPGKNKLTTERFVVVVSLQTCIVTGYGEGDPVNLVYIHFCLKASLLISGHLPRKKAN